MRLIHESPAAGKTTVATTVETADSFLARARGLMFRRSLPDDYALAFRFDDVGRRDVHMVFVGMPLDVVWVVDDDVTRVEQLRPWRDLAAADADLLVELPAGSAVDIETGDTLYLDETDVE